ncbi:MULTISPECIES: hypothetical protein [Corynebacterium]|uniref:PE-PPE domain-containing protein n=1 Tax=Corynebacterium provencense TaxID=1737425 RepID=A0A2Z3YN72_9CORY|nr:MULTISPECIES: hypothetical protein [Corynebacterium]AWT26655.1 hypothetical protein Csp1_18820 [Corynebacterium provencense]MCI1256728.1 hypothetical protein [Corynebacterium provencense]
MAVSSLIVSVPAASAGVPSGAGTPGNRGGSCPATVIVAARGSEETSTTPARYEGTDLPSNGWEGDTIRRFISYLATAHPEAVSGGRVAAAGVDADHYPARLPVPRELAEFNAVTIAQDVALFVDSVVKGVPGGLEQVKSWEEESGCRPDYVTVGYSQGVLPVMAVQQWASDRGRLRGVISVGSPFGGEPGTVGTVAEAPDGVPSMNICATYDVICAHDMESLGEALEAPYELGAHTEYFRQALAGRPTALEKKSVDTLAEWLSD